MKYSLAPKDTLTKFMFDKRLGYFRTVPGLVFITVSPVQKSFFRHLFFLDKLKIHLSVNRVNTTLSVFNNTV